MDFKPKTEREIREESLAAKGDYDFDVLKAEDTVSKSSGKPMITVKIGLYVGDKVRHHVNDYLMESMGAKLRHFCDTVGLLAEYESGSLTAEMCKGRSGRVRIIVDDKDEAYPPKNAVRDYIVRETKAIASAVPESAAKEPKDDLPF